MEPSPSIIPQKKSIPDSNDVLILEREKSRLTKVVEFQEEKLRKLKLVKIHHEKNDLETLNSLTLKWQDVCQNALTELYGELPEPKPTFCEFLDSFQINHELIKYNSDSQTFEKD